MITLLSNVSPPFSSHELYCVGVAWFIFFAILRSTR